MAAVEPAQLRAMAEAIVAQMRGKRLEVGRKAPDLQRFSVFEAVPVAERRAFMSAALKDPVTERAVGAMVGMAVGDAVGAPLEFLSAGEQEPGFNPVTFKYEDEYNKFRLQRGQWTDDCSMGLCMADSLLLNRGYDGSDMRVRFWNWWYRGYDNAFRKDTWRDGSVGLGGNIGKSLDDIFDANPTPRFEAATEDSGNGSLMRLAPVPLFFHKDPLQAARWSSESSYSTHPGPIAAEVCGFLGFVLSKALLRPAREAGTAAEFLEACVQEYAGHLNLREEPGAPELDSRRILWQLLCGTQPVGSRERCWNWRDPAGPFIAETLQARGRRYNGYPVSSGYFGAYSVDGLAIALHSIYHTSSFLAAITKCVNFRGDADSTAAIAGQMAGAFYGYGQIDARCIANLEKWDDGEIGLRGALLCTLSIEASAAAGAAAPNHTPKRPKTDEPGAEPEIPEESGAQMFTVYPRSFCPHLPTIGSWRVGPSARCEVCGEGECWVCGTCGKILCSRYRKAHMVEHADQSGHCVALSLSDLSFWCFRCDAYLDVFKIPELQALYSECHLEKFGSLPPMPGRPGTASGSS